MQPSVFSFVRLVDFVLLELTLLSSFAVSSMPTYIQQTFIQIRMNNIFISPLEAPDNALIEADKPPLIPFFFMADKIMPLGHGN